MCSNKIASCKNAKQQRQNQNPRWPDLKKAFGILGKRMFVERWISLLIDLFQVPPKRKSMQFNKEWSRKNNVILGPRASLVDSRCDPVFELSRLRNSVVYGMLYWPV